MGKQTLDEVVRALQFQRTRGLENYQAFAVREEVIQEDAPIDFEEPNYTFDHIQERLMRHSPAYFASEMLMGPPEPPYRGKFLISEHHEEWDKIIRDKDRVCILASRDSGKSFFFSQAYPIWMAWLHPNKSGFIFSATQEQAIEILDRIKHEIESNPKLRFLLPTGSRKQWSKTKIRLSNGHTIYARGFGTRVRGAHPWWCVCQPKGTQILTRKGYVDVSEVKVGDEVWTHKGRWRPVVKTGKRRSELVGYKIAGNVDVEWATPEHKFWDGSEFILPKKGDWVEAPILSGGIRTTVTEAQAQLLGLFLGDGTLTQHKNRRTYGTYDRYRVIIYVSKYEDEIDQLIRSAGYTPCWSDGATCRRVHIENKDFYDLCSQLKVAGNSQKRITFAMERWPRRLQKALVKGYWMADGCRTQAKGRSVEYKATSVAKPLLLSLQRILVRLGVTSSVRRLRSAKTMQIEGREVRCQETFDLRCTWVLGALFGWEQPPKRLVNNKRQYIVGDTIKRRIEGVEYRESEEVYSFTVAEDHSYSGHLVCTHNCDDVLNDETAWSETTRRKQNDYFFSAITNMIVPGGQLTVVGTPFCAQDLYWQLARNTKGRYHYGVYPAINPDGTALWPERYPLDRLKLIRDEIGEIRFGRERMCQTSSDDMSLFPSYLFEGQPVEQYQVKLGMPHKFWEELGCDIYIGVDFAMSSNVKADYTVIIVVAVDKRGNRWLVDMVRERGLAYNTQKSLIVKYGRRYHPVLMYLEANQMQRIFGDELIQETDLPIYKFTTTGTEKHSLEKGLPSLRVLFENGKIRLPLGDERSVDVVEKCKEEFHGFTFIDGKVESMSEHDDIPMAFWICDQAIRKGSFSFAADETDEDEGKPFDYANLPEAQEKDEWAEDVQEILEKERNLSEHLQQEMERPAEISVGYGDEETEEDAQDDADVFTGRSQSKGAKYWDVPV